MRTAFETSAPSVGSTVVREAFDSGFTLYFSDHSSVSVEGTFTFRDADGESTTLTASPTGIAAHATKLVALIGMEVGANDYDLYDAILLRFTSGIVLVLPRSERHRDS
ncbi:hypothetical protein CH300_17825 [Rhodococcus sp. 15-1154-1]|nr:hypothetical protein CH300_17825 [Rhodococcus sp. 15-1154-1]